MPKQPKPVPEFATEAEERAFWDAHSSADYVDWDQAIEVPLDAMPLLTRSPARVQVVAEVPPDDWAALTVLARRRGVSPEVLAGALLREGIEKARMSA